jgi:hypothetical protein
MKAITTTAPLPKADSCFDATLNPVALSSGEIVSWGLAFPRPRTGGAGRSTKGDHLGAGSTRRSGALTTPGSVLGALGRAA